MYCKRITASFIALLVFVVAVKAQTTDTIRILQYNLLNYGDNNNPESFKDPRLSTIINYVNPDIFGANEIANSSSHSQNILNNVLGAGWEKGAFVNGGNEIQTNMLFWKTDKFGLKFQKSISHTLRDIIAFNLYYKDPQLDQTKDTVFLTVIVAHLKAGNTTQNENERATETQTVVNYLNSMGKDGNYVFMGDFNLYSSDEQAYKNITTNANINRRLYDPINRPGKWSANSTFSDIHTQSTRLASLPDGGVTGGLDDRFDHMLVSSDVLNHTDRCMYIPNTYMAVGQDGKHFNKAVNSSPANANVPANVIEALYEMSDHLPIRADFTIDRTMFANNVQQQKIANNIESIKVTNPFNDKLILTNINAQSTDIRVTLFSIDGRIVFDKNVNVQKNMSTYNIDLPSNWNTGLYVLQLQNSLGEQVTKQLVKQ